jgi:predicted short-subunit dehydrogenase-like oxidoreductase (DUF2520 family)
LKSIKKIVILGSGNVASNLAPAIQAKGLEIVQVYSRSLDHAAELAGRVGAEPVSEIKQLTEDADLYLFCISDSAIISLLEQKSWEGKLLAHTAGSMPLEIFKPYTQHYGVVYPFQTFTKGYFVDIEKVSVFVESSTAEIQILLESFAKKITPHVSRIDSVQRTVLHLAGVFANNFGNHMFSIATELLRKNDLEIESIRPLIEETCRKALCMDPKLAQTGPALRNNEQVLNKHIEMLHAEPDWQKIYTFVSSSIKNFHKQNDE